MLQGAASLCEEVQTLLDNNREKPTYESESGKRDSSKPLIIGLYYDDPESVPEDELRFAVGAILSSGKFAYNQNNILRLNYIAQL